MKRYGRYTVVREVEKHSGNRMLLVHCDCGIEKIVRLRHLELGAIISCGCASRERVTTHGQTVSRTPEYAAWGSMIQRCENPKNPRYKDYGGRGISVCSAWHKFENFFADMGQRPSHKHSIDRKNNDGNYEPDNCRWATVIEQHDNMRLCETFLLTIDDKPISLAAAANYLALPTTTFQRWIKNAIKTNRC